MEKLNVRFNDGTKAEIKSLATKTGLSESVIARAAINRGLTRLGSILHVDGLDNCKEVIDIYEPIFNA